MLVDLQTTPLGRLRAVFRFKQPGSVLIELSINPVECQTLSNQQLTQILQAIGDGRVDHLESAGGGSQWDEVMAFAKRWHEAVCTVLGHVITTVRIEEARTTNEVLRDLPEPTPLAQQAALRFAASAGGNSSETGGRRGHPH